MRKVSYLIEMKIETIGWQWQCHIFIPQMCALFRLNLYISFIIIIKLDIHNSVKRFYKSPSRRVQLNFAIMWFKQTINLVLIQMYIVKFEEANNLCYCFWDIAVEIPTDISRVFFLWEHVYVWKFHNYD